MELDDLIRRGDAMLAAVDLGDERIADAIRALPARGVGVKPWPQEEIAPGVYVDVDPESLAALAPTDAAQAREAEMTVPDEIELYRIIKRSGAKKRIDVARAVSAHLEPMRRAFAALAPTDAAQAREAALREAADALNERGVREQADFGLDRGTQNFFRARDLVRALIGEPRT